MDNKDKHAQCLDHPDESNVNQLRFKEYCVSAKRNSMLPAVSCYLTTFCGSGKAYRVNYQTSGGYSLSVNKWLPPDSFRYYTAVAFAQVNISHMKKIPLLKCSDDPDFIKELERFNNLFISLSPS